ncbi:hypothetical protein DSECCO2_585620 [anaerobic digester metagenome]|jgi:hypothetical protein
MKFPETGLRIPGTNRKTPAGKIQKELQNRSGQAQNKSASDKLIHKKFYFMVA